MLTAQPQLPPTGPSLRKMTELRRHVAQSICRRLSRQSFETLDNLTPTLLAEIIVAAIEEAQR